MALIVSVVASVLLIQAVAWLGSPEASGRQRRWAIVLSPAALFGVAGGLALWLMRWLGAS